MQIYPEVFKLSEATKRIFFFNKTFCTLFLQVKIYEMHLRFFPSSKRYISLSLSAFLTQDTDLWSYSTEGHVRKRQQVWDRLFWGTRNILWTLWDSVYSAPKLYLLLTIPGLHRKQFPMNMLTRASLVLGLEVAW